MSEALSDNCCAARARLVPFARLAVLLALSATGSYVAMAAVVSLQPPPNGGVLHIPVLVAGEGDEALAGLQFDLHYDEAHYVLEAIQAGGAAAGAGKEAILSLPAPGMGRVLITGFNDNILADGHVATLILRARTPGAAAHGLSVRNLLATDGHGYSVPIAYQDDYGYPPAPPEKQEPRRAEESDGGAPEEGSGGVDGGEPQENDELAPEARADEGTFAENNLASPPTDGRGDSAFAAAGAVSVGTRPGPPHDSEEGVGGATPAAPRGSPKAPASASATAPIYPPDQGRAGEVMGVGGGTSPSGPDDRAAQPLPLRGAPGGGAHGGAEGDGGKLHLALATPTRRGGDAHAAGVAGAPVQSGGTAAGTGGRPFAGAALFALFFVTFCALHWRMVRWLSRPARRRAP